MPKVGSYPADQNSAIKKGFHFPVFEMNVVKAKIKGICFCGKVQLSKTFFKQDSPFSAKPGIYRSPVKITVHRLNLLNYKLTLKTKTTTKLSFYRYGKLNQ